MKNVPPAPVNHYANSKLAMEHTARTYGERLPLLITRPFNYTGPGQATHFLVPKIVEHIKRRETVIELGNTHVSRDFSDVRDIVAVYAHLLNGRKVRPVAVCLMWEVAKRFHYIR